MGSHGELLRVNGHSVGSLVSQGWEILGSITPRVSLTGMASTDRSQQVAYTFVHSRLCSAPLLPTAPGPTGWPPSCPLSVRSAPRGAPTLRIRSCEPPSDLWPYSLTLVLNSVMTLPLTPALNEF